MPRRREVPKREILPDPKYGNVELSKFMNVIMEGGKKLSLSASFTVPSSKSNKNLAKIPWSCSLWRSTTSSRWSR